MANQMEKNKFPRTFDFMYKTNKRAMAVSIVKMFSYEFKTFDYSLTVAYKRTFQYRFLC